MKARLERRPGVFGRQSAGPLSDAGRPADGTLTDEVRARFHQLALEHHPDRGGSEEQMRKINSAYERALATRSGSGETPRSTK